MLHSYQRGHKRQKMKTDLHVKRRSTHQKHIVSKITDVFDSGVVAFHDSITNDLRKEPHHVEYTNYIDMTGKHEYRETDTVYDFIETDKFIQDTLAVIKPVTEVSCKRLFEKDTLEIGSALLKVKTMPRHAITSFQYLNITRNCDNFKQQRGYFNSSVTTTEKNFPIAFSIVAYKKVEQIERLLRAIYRPQNYYCIHMDLKSSILDIGAVRAITSCFPNVVIPTTSVSVEWGQFSVLEAELICMQALWKFGKWKYFINLTGQEFPLKTNLELVEILNALKGANIVGGSRNRVRYVNTRRYENSGHPPHGIRVAKGPVHVVVNRDFVDFALHDNKSLDFLEWLKDTGVPDESFFSSLNHNPHLGIPGSFLGDVEEYPEKPLISRFKNWRYPNGDWNRPCSGVYIHDICIFGVSDLHRLQDTLGLFVNKILLNFQHFTFDCLEEMILNRTRDQYLYRQSIDVSVYGHLDQVKLRLVK